MAGLPGEARSQTARAKAKCVPNPLYDYPNAARTGKCLKKRRETPSNTDALSEQQRRAVDELRRVQEMRILEIQQRTRELLSEQRERMRRFTRQPNR